MWAAVAVAVIAAAAGFVAVAGFKPGYDPYGWLVWGRQTLHWNLNTDGAPSWKPLTFLFTLPFALFGHTAVALWTVTATAGTLAGGVFAARIAFWLTGPTPDRRWAPYVAGAFAGVGVLGMITYAHLTLIANSDQLNVALGLAAIDMHLRRRPGWAFAAVVLAALGRPETWAFAGLYGVWVFWKFPRLRFAAAIGLLLIPALWFSVPALTSKSWLRPGDLALNQHTIIHGNKVIGVIQRWAGLYEVPMRVAAVLGVVWAVIRRDAETLGLAAAALLWVAVEIAFAYHGWSAVSRYLIEPASVMIVIAGSFVGRLLADTSTLSRPLRWAGPVLVLILLATLIPAARNRESVWHHGIDDARQDAKALDRLADVVARVGGGSAIRACGQPDAKVQYQSQLAWAVGLNVGKTGYNPGLSIKRGKPLVVFKALDDGWELRPYNLAPRTAKSCARLRVNSAMG